MKRLCLALDLVNDAKLIAEYEDYHKKVWPEVLQSLTDSGISWMEIYRIENRLFMVIEASDDFSLEKKGAMDENNTKVQEWEVLMWKYQKALPSAKPGQKWIEASCVFKL